MNDSLAMAPETLAGGNILDDMKPVKKGRRQRWGQLYGSAPALAITTAARQHNGPVIVVTANMPDAEHLEDNVRFYNGPENGAPLLSFPDRETLPYDNFSPHQDIISRRLGTLSRLPGLDKGILICPVSTLMVRLPPQQFLAANSFLMNKGDRLAIEPFRRRLQDSGYRHVSQVMEHGEYSVRGSLIDLYPMGSQAPYRIDLLDDEIDTIRIFDSETQRTIRQVDRISLMPAREFPLHDEAITLFRQQYRARFEGDPQQSALYRDVSNGLAPSGIEYYLPLFFGGTELFFDYLPDNALLLIMEGCDEAARQHWQEIVERYEQRRHDIERPVLAPDDLFIPPQRLEQCVADYPSVELAHFGLDEHSHGVNLATRPPPVLTVAKQAPQPLKALTEFISRFDGCILFVAESSGRREALLDLLHGHSLYPAETAGWTDFLHDRPPLAITVAPLDQGLLIDEPALAVITEPQLFGVQVMQQRRRKRRERDAESLIQHLSELEIGAPVVHEEHGIGRYAGLQNLTIDGIETEFLTLVYAGDDRLYVPVSSLHLISRYSGASPDQAPLHKLGSDQWQKAKRKAAERVRDVAAELLDIYARREARQGHAFPELDDQYAQFAAAFPFEETPDQHEAIADVITDMISDKPMDRLVCGDVGFGKTEVAMRAAFLAVNGNRQVAVLVPTTLLAQQHYENFRDRFADLPVRIELLSRFRSGKAQQATLDAIASGKADIVVGTHKLLQESVRFDNLGLVIIDEEHRFGVRQKERFKALRAEVDVLTLTATPIPRTLNMAMSGMRDLSIIATAPLRRLAIKTFVREWNNALVREAILREIRRGGQVYFLHNEVRSIEKTVTTLEKLLPEAEIRFAHGQMRELELEHIMSDFYHQRFNVLVCTTIIESGIDVPNANTILINRADKLGLAQLYQIRGRVGRSHHQAYAYLIIPPRTAVTADAVKRLEAIESLEDLGAGFTLATHDLEIRGAGELLGDEQSGQIQEIGFTMYTELLERAVAAMKSGQQPELEQPLALHAEVDMHIPALLPDDYLPDVHTRLVMYKRIASATSNEELDELQVEMIDRFGLLPQAAKNLMRITQLKLVSEPLGVRKIDAGPGGGRIIFNDRPNINLERLIQLIQLVANVYKFDGRNKLTFTLPDDDIETRFTFVGKLLDELTP